MWLDEADGFAELFKGYLPYYVLVALPIFFIMSPVNQVAAAHDFSVYRMQQYDLHTVPHGCRSSVISMEGRSVKSWSTVRHCVMSRIQDITIDQLMEIGSKAGALVLVLPKNDTNLTPEQQEHIQLLEMAATTPEFIIPVYLMHWSEEAEEILMDLEDSFAADKASTAFEALLNSVSSNGYQFVTTVGNPQKMESKPVTLHGKLVGSMGSGQTIVVAAHYDAGSMVPELSFGADSNASGVVALLELARIFSRLYSAAATRGMASIVFVLTGTGASVNYFSAKKWLEDQLDGSDSSLLQDVSFVMCLDAISSPQLSMHVSKPPKAGGAAHSIQSRLGVPIVHKKINLAEELLAWQHERFSIRRMTAFTLSSLKSHKDPSRSSILDKPNEQAILNLIANVKQTARGLASHIYNLTGEDNKQDSILYDEALSVDEASIRNWYKYLSSQSRSAHIITTGLTPGINGVSASLERALSRYIGEVTTSIHTTDKREPEFVLYGPTRAVLNVYNVKPAVFDLILTVAIVIYLTIFYFAIQWFPRFYEEYAKMVTGKEKVY